MKDGLSVSDDEIKGADTGCLRTARERSNRVDVVGREAHGEAGKGAGRKRRLLRSGPKALGKLGRKGARMQREERGPHRKPAPVDPHECGVESIETRPGHDANNEARAVGGRSNGSGAARGGDGCGVVVVHGIGIVGEPRVRDKLAPAPCSSNGGSRPSVDRVALGERGR